MSLAENLLNSLPDSANSNSRMAGSGEKEPHIVVEASRKIKVPNSLKTIGVKGDEDIETVTIDCVRYWDGHDLAQFAIYLYCTLPNKTDVTYIPDTFIIKDNQFSFDWTLDRDFTSYVGRLTFWIVAKKTDDAGLITHQWSSLKNSDLYIAEGGDRIYVPEDQTDKDVISQAISASKQAIQRAELAADEAEDSAEEANDAELGAQDAANRAESAATRAEKAETNSLANATTATEAKNNAINAENNAKNSETAALGYKNTAVDQANLAKGYADEAKSAKSAAQSSASSASQSASVAETSRAKAVESKEAAEKSAKEAAEAATRAVNATENKVDKDVFNKAIEDIVGLAPEKLDTLAEAADAIQKNERDITSIKSTINDLHTTGAEIWLVITEGGNLKYINWADLAKEQGASLNVELVDTLPETIHTFDDTAVYAYVVKSTGIAYVDLGTGVISLGQMVDGADNGWTDDINAETEEGFYCVPVLGDFAEKKDITWENLPDKPFGEITENLGDTVIWDGNIDEGNDVITNSASLGTGTMRYVKVSDCAPTIDDIGSNPTFKIMDETGTEQTPEKVTVIEKEGIITIGYGFAFVQITLTDNSKLDDIVFPEKGVYFLQMITADGSIASRCTSLTIPNYNFGTKTTLKKIDEKYLPDTILIKSESIEIWLIDNEPENLTAQIKAGGVTINIEVVDTLPESLELTSMENGIMNVYVVESTGIAYLDIGEGAMTFGLAFTGNEIYNKGWSTDISAETEGGVYCVRTEKNVPTKEYVDNAVATAIGNAIGGSY